MPRYRWAARKFNQIRVGNITKIFYSDFAGEESVAAPLRGSEKHSIPWAERGVIQS
jgi:hypothetical protein